MNIILSIGAFLGFSSVLMGAYAGHALNKHLEPRLFEMLWTAIRYHQLYAIVVTMIGLCLLAPLTEAIKKQLVWTATLFIGGVLFFSLGMYLSVFLKSPIFTQLTPIGGLLFMFAWLLLFWTSLRLKFNVAAPEISLIEPSLLK